MTDLDWFTPFLTDPERVDITAPEVPTRKHPAPEKLPASERLKQAWDRLNGFDLPRPPNVSLP